MDSSLKQRLVGAAVLVALAVIFLPMLVKGPAPDSGVSDVSLEIPAEPNGDTGSNSVDLPLIPENGMPQGGVVGMPANQAARDDATPAGGGVFPSVAAGNHVVSFGSYATPVDADRVIAALASAELPAYREVTRVSGREAHRVRIGPFADRAIAESARLRAGQVSDTVDAKVIVLDADPAAPAPGQIAIATAPAPVPSKPQLLPPVAKPVTPAVSAPTKPIAAATSATPMTAAPTPTAVAKPAADTSKTGFAVQAGAFSTTADANALRDKLRGAGFNAFTDTVSTDKGVLTRVRVGPAMNRAEADALKASVKSKLGIDGMVRPHP
ncbi:MAG: SPOR domain-containing protein [Pseudomonadota bacterium]|nr:SPOR domain-containing protein [Pseudomonadota bacterium]